MEIKVTIYNVIILFGVFQGFLLSALIILFKFTRTNKYLLMMLLAFSINTLKMILFDMGLFNDYPQLTFIPFFFYLIGPAVYFYSKELIGLKTDRKIVYLHFLPFALNTIYYLASLLFFSTGRLDFHENSFRFFEEMFSLISVGTYLVLTIINVQKHQILRRDFFSDDSTFTLQWLRNLIVATIGGWVFWLVLYILDFTINYFNSYPGAEAYYPLYIYMSTFIYWIGYSGYIRKEFKPVQMDQSSQRQLSDEELNELESLIQRVNSDRLFSQVSLKIDQLAEQLGTKSSQISFLINNGLNKTFYDFINELRIESFKDKLADKNLNHLTIQSLAEDSGFKSRSTYNDLFKKYVGTTPRLFKEKEQAK